MQTQQMLLVRVLPSFSPHLRIRVVFGNTKKLVKLLELKLLHIPLTASRFIRY